MPLMLLDPPCETTIKTVLTRAQILTLGPDALCGMSCGDAERHELCGMRFAALRIPRGVAPLLEKW